MVEVGEEVNGTGSVQAGRALRMPINVPTTRQHLISQSSLQLASVIPRPVVYNILMKIHILCDEHYQQQ